MISFLHACSVNPIRQENIMVQIQSFFPFLNQKTRHQIRALRLQLVRTVMTSLLERQYKNKHLLFTFISAIMGFCAFNAIPLTIINVKMQCLYSASNLINSGIHKLCKAKNKNKINKIKFNKICRSGPLYKIYIFLNYFYYTEK